MRIIIGLLLFSLAICSCTGFNAMNGANPQKSSFKYYDPDFSFKNEWKLKRNTKYVLIKDDSISSILIFFDDGFLNKHITPAAYIDSTRSVRLESGVIMGYYKITGDSIHFTTKSYYEHRATRYKGVLSNDSILLETKYPKDKSYNPEVYTPHK